MYIHVHIPRYCKLRIVQWRRHSDNVWLDRQLHQSVGLPKSWRQAHSGLLRDAVVLFMLSPQTYQSVITLSHNSRTVTKCGLFQVICMTCVPEELTNISQCEVSYLQWSVQTLDEAKDSVVTLEVTDHEILAGSADSRVRRYDIRNGQLQVDYIGRKTFVL